MTMLFSLSRLTVEGQVSEESCQQIHDEHGQEGHVGNALHLFAGAAVLEKEGEGVFCLDTRTRSPQRGRTELSKRR